MQRIYHWRGRVRHDLDLAEVLFPKIISKSGAVKTMIGLSTRIGSHLTEGISANAKLSITKTNGFLNNAQNPVRRKQIRVRTDKADVQVKLSS